MVCIFGARVVTYRTPFLMYIDLLFN